MPEEISSLTLPPHNDILITGANVVTPDGILRNHDLYIQKDRITALGPAGTLNHATLKTYDVNGDYLIPGLIDLHVHGAGGFDTMDAAPASLASMREALLREGTTAFLATTMTCREEILHQALANLTENGSQSVGKAELLGAHVEGPFISPLYKGAQNPEHIWPDDPVSAARLFECLLQKYPGLIKILTLAVERMGLPRIAALAQQYHVILSAGHTAASYDQMLHAIELGVKHISHAYNAIPGIHHRNPGPLTAGLLDHSVGMEIIADAVHIHPAVLDLTLRLKSAEHVYLISDGTRAVGMPDGTYELGGQLTVIQEGMSILPNGAIAGSAVPLLQGIRVLTQTLNYPLHQAVSYASLNPARLLSIAHRVGSLAPEREATFLRLSASLDLKEVWQYGRLVMERM